MTSRNAMFLTRGKQQPDSWHFRAGPVWKAATPRSRARMGQFVGSTRADYYFEGVKLSRTEGSARVSRPGDNPPTQNSETNRACLRAADRRWRPRRRRASTARRAAPSGSAPAPGGSSRLVCFLRGHFSRARGPTAQRSLEQPSLRIQFKYWKPIVS